MEKRVANNFPGPPPPAPYYHNNNNYNPHHHQIHPPQTPYHHVAAVGYQQYPQNENRDHRFNQPPHFDNHYPQVQQQQSQPPQNLIGDHSSNNNPPFTPSSSSSGNGFSPSGGVNSRKRKSLSATGFSPDPSVEGSSIAKLYVASVTKITSEDEIRQVFEKYGNVIEIILPKDKMTGERAAYCFVKYKKVEEGYAAIAALTDQFTFPGETAPVKVRFADAERERIGFPTVQVPEKVYVRCLNKLTTKAEIHEVFGRYGVIEDIYIALDDMKISRGYGFVQFSRREMALAAINGLNGIFTMRGSDQPLIVRFADPKKPRLGEPRSAFNTPPAMQQFDPNWHPQPYSQWGNNEPAAPRVVQHHDFASQPNNHFPQQNAQAVSETAGVETRSALPEDENECDWSEHTCPDGNKYYFHCVTYESTWEKPEEYSMLEKWLEEQQDQKLVSTPINNQSQGSTENSEQVESHLLQETTKLQQPSLPTTDQENNLAHSVTRLAVETTCS